MKVKPAPGMTVRDPHTLAILPEDGREVPDHDMYWLRRVRDADVIVEEQDDGGEENGGEEQPTANRSPQMEA